jgi:RNA polymerase sigma factor (sigma-70 family)
VFFQEVGVRILGANVNITQKTISLEVGLNAQVDSSGIPHDAFDQNRGSLAKVIEENYTRLLGGIRALVWKMGISDNPSTVDMVAQEIFHETVVVALEKSDRYDPIKPAHSWLLGIAANKIKEYMRNTTYRESKTPSVVNAHTSIQNKKRNMETSDLTQKLTEEEMLDFLLYHSSENPLWQGRIHLSFDELISLVNEVDRLVLNLAFNKNLRGKDLAATLGISEGAAYVRLSRAISRVREAYLKSENLEEQSDVKQ